MVLFIISCILDMHIAMMCTACDLAGVVPPLQHPGAMSVAWATPWGTMGAGGRARGCPEPDDAKHSLEWLELQFVRVSS